MTQVGAPWPCGDGEMAGRIRAHDWASTPLGPVERWPPSLRTAVGMVLAMPSPATILWGPQHVQIYNDAYVAIARDRHPALLGRPAVEGWPDVYATVIAPLMDSARAGNATRLVGFPVALKGSDDRLEERIFDTEWSPIRDETGSVAGALQTLVDATGLLKAQTAMRESEARHRLLIGSWAQAEWETDADGVVVADSPSWRAYTGQTEEGWLGYGWLDAIHPDDRSCAERQWREAIQARGRVDAEFRLRAPDGGWRWTNVRAAPVLDAGGGVEKWAGMNIDIDARKRAEATLRDSEERQAFLLKLSDALRPIENAQVLRRTACRMLGEHLSAERAYYVEYEPEAGYGRVADDYLIDGLPSLAGQYSFEAFRATYERIADGKTWVVPDVSAAVDLPAHERDFYASQGVSAWINVPLAKDGVLEAALCTVQSTPRAWKAVEIALVEETAERLWSAIQRDRAEAALRASEERFQQFGEASSDVLWIRDAETLQWVYLTPAFERIYGIDRATALAGDNMTGWLDLIVPEDRRRAVEAIERVRAGERVAFEYRVRQDDGTVRWLRNTDFPMRDAAEKVCWIGGVGRDVTEEKASAQRLEVLVNELQHRSRNLLGVVTAMANRTVGRGSSAESFLVRLKALSRAQALLSQGGSDTVAVEALVRAELAAHADNAPDRIIIDGPAVTLTSQQMQNFALALHELTTNAVKYGALKDGTGCLSVTWELIRTAGGPHLALNWVETGVDVPPEAATRRGYGRELIEQALAYALGGRTDYVLGDGGVRCRIELPIA